MQDHKNACTDSTCFSPLITIEYIKKKKSLISNNVKILQSQLWSPVLLCWISSLVYYVLEPEHQSISTTQYKENEQLFR